MRCVGLSFRFRYRWFAVIPTLNLNGKKSTGWLERLILYLRIVTRKISHTYIPVQHVFAKLYDAERSMWMDIRNSACVQFPLYQNSIHTQINVNYVAYTMKFGVCVPFFVPLCYFSSKLTCHCLYAHIIKTKNKKICLYPFYVWCMEWHIAYEHVVVRQISIPFFSWFKQIFIYFLCGYFCPFYTRVYNKYMGNLQHSPDACLHNNGVWISADKTHVYPTIVCYYRYINIARVCTLKCTLALSPFCHSLSCFDSHYICLLHAEREHFIMHVSKMSSNTISIYCTLHALSIGQSDLKWALVGSALNKVEFLKQRCCFSFSSLLLFFLNTVSATAYN